LIPFSFRQPVKEIKDVKLVNDFCAVGCKIPIKKSIQDALLEQKKIFNHLKNSFDAIGAYTLVQLNIMLPFNLPAILTDHVT